MAPTPSSTSKNNTHFTIIKTPQSKHRILFTKTLNPNGNITNTPQDHPVEVITRIRNNPDEKKDKNSSGVLQINPDQRSIRVRAEFGYRDFSLDGVSSSEDEDIDGFYKKYIEERIVGVKRGGKCTIMMYGPTGSGKSYTMFGCLKHPGIVYRSLKGILGDKEERNGDGEVGMFVHVSVLEIYNEEIYDLLSCEKSGAAAGGSFNFWSKGSASKVKLEVMGKKAKNASFISGNKANEILKEIQKVEKRRIVKSTNCNDRSSRSHCLIILDAPTVGGRLMLVDMAGSENIEQAGQVGFEAKMQTAKINQGNIALKRVVESIANGDSHVPFRDSKLTMLLQDSFEDTQSKILMILCASPDPKEMHKTISTLEYGAKAKCIIRGPHTPDKDKMNGEGSSVILGSRIAAMDQFILKLQMENKQREKECNEARKQLLKKEEEVSIMRAKLDQVGVKMVVGASEEDINEMVNQRTQMLRMELEKQLEECKRMANEYIELEKRRMEEKILSQQQEVEMLRRRLQEMEIELRSKDGNGSSSSSSSSDDDGVGFIRRIKEAYGEEQMEKSMDLDNGEHETREEKIIGHNCFITPMVAERRVLSTVFEEEEEVDNDSDKDGGVKMAVEEVEKKVIEEVKVSKTCIDNRENMSLTPTSRKTRIENIFTLCGNHRELSQRVPGLDEKRSENNVDAKSPAAGLLTVFTGAPVCTHAEPYKENMNPAHDDKSDVLMEVYVKWEATKENPGKFINKLKVVKDATLSDLRKLIEIHLGIDKQDFTFLSLGDPTGAPISKEKEATVLASKLPTCNNQLGGHLACLRPAKGAQSPSLAPFSPITNISTPISCMRKLDDSSSPLNLGSTPYITVRRY